MGNPEMLHAEFEPELNHSPIFVACSDAVRMLSIFYLQTTFAWRGNKDNNHERVHSCFCLLQHEKITNNIKANIKQESHSNLLSRSKEHLVVWSKIYREDCDFKTKLKMYCLMSHNCLKKIQKTFPHVICFEILVHDLWQYASFHFDSWPITL